MKAKINLKNIRAYLTGNIRYMLYYSYFCFLIPKHIKEQIDLRIRAMDEECYEAGSCKMCGCNTPALQMSNKACDKPCYPSMLDKKKWAKLQSGALTYDKPTKMMWWIKKGRLLNYKSAKEHVD